MMRDSYYTGMNHLGTIAHTRIIDHAEILDDGVATLVYSDKILEDMTHALDGRQHLYTNVYLHKTAMAGSILVEAILDQLPGLVERTKDLEKFAFLNDMIVQEALTNPDTENLVKRFLTRNLPKLVFKCKQYADEPLSRELTTFLALNAERDDLHTIYTRVINGIEPSHFDKYGIRFLTSDRGAIICQEILKTIRYQPPVSFKLIRVYLLAYRS
jgi:HD superfamily phosphohydrolase